MREFITSYRLDFSLNAKQTLINNQPSTIRSYLKRFNAMCGHLPNENLYIHLSDRIDNIERKRVLGRIKSSTVRQYKAALCFGLSLVALEDDFEDTGPLVKRSLTHEQAQELYKFASELKTDETFSQTKNRDRKAHKQANTSSKKLKEIPKGFLEALTNLCQQPNSYRHLKDALKFLQANCIIGLRPAEWYDIEVLSREELEASEHFKKQIKETHNVLLGEELKIGELYLCLKNFKNSQGRACGDYRYICIDNLSQKEMSIVSDWIKISNYYIKKKAIDNPHDYYDRFMSKLQDSIRYIENNEPTIEKILNANFKKRQTEFYSNEKKAIEKMKTYKGKPPIRQQVTLYSSRHQAVANAKFSGLGDLQIAALFGHSSTSTAREHYGKVGAAKGFSRLSPHPVNMKQVILKSNLMEKQAKLVKQATPTMSYEQGQDMDFSPR